MIDKVSKLDCVGCKACGDICPVNAITYEIDNEGFWFPTINSDACIKCGLCERACPALKCHYASPENYNEPKVYKVYHKDKSIRYNSTSGALYYGLADAFLRDGGYIVGCVYDDDWKGAHHYIANSYDGLKKIMRTKYFQSDTEGIYRQVKKLLDSGEKVLFCGAPCQVSALYGFVGEKYPNLYSVDFICLGINSPMVFRKFIEELEQKYKSEVAEVHLKNKSKGWTNLGTLVRFKNGKEYYGNRITDPWVNSFVSLRIHIRKSCEGCKYKTFPRIADISMGDFWGLKFTDEEEKFGVSLALVNSPKGDFLLEKASDNFVVEKRTVEEATAGNPMILNRVKLNPKRDDFFEKLNKKPFSKVVWSLEGSNKVKRIYMSLKHSTKKIIMSMCGK